MSEALVLIGVLVVAICSVESPRFSERSCS